MFTNLCPFFNLVSWFLPVLLSLSSCFSEPQAEALLATSSGHPRADVTSHAPPSPSPRAAPHVACPQNREAARITRIGSGGTNRKDPVRLPSGRESPTLKDPRSSLQRRVQDPRGRTPDLTPPHKEVARAGAVPRAARGRSAAGTSRIIDHGLKAARIGLSPIVPGTEDAVPVPVPRARARDDLTHATKSPRRTKKRKTSTKPTSITDTA